LNNPIQVIIGPQTQKIFDYWKGAGAKPSQDEAMTGLLQFAQNTNIKNTIIHRGVIDAMTRQVHTADPLPFGNAVIVPGRIVYATDYDMGRSGVSYHDKDSAEYWVSTTKRTPWNSGGQYRNDGVDIEKCTDAITNGYNVGWIETGEWLQYSIYFPEEGSFDINFRTAGKETAGMVQLIVNNELQPVKIQLPRTGETQQWETSTMRNIKFNKGWNRLRVLAATGGFNLNYLQFTPADISTKTD
jgi:endoglucanase